MGKSLGNGLQKSPLFSVANVRIDTDCKTHG